jgi:hypothetical protein
MPGLRHSPHRFEFIGETPKIVWALVILLFANTYLGISQSVFHPVVYLPPNDQGLHKYATIAILWQAKRWGELQVALLVVLGVTLRIYRKTVRYVYRGSRLSK